MQEQGVGARTIYDKPVNWLSPEELFQTTLSPDRMQPFLLKNRWVLLCGGHLWERCQIQMWYAYVLSTEVRTRIRSHRLCIMRTLGVGDYPLLSIVRYTNGMSMLP
jgi:hypothetical protein